MNALYQLPAPAKLNLFLHITGRRPDRYHLIESVFVLLDWCDTIHLERRADGLIRRTDIANETSQHLPEVDLCIKAARLLQTRLGCTDGVDILLEKRIPAQAGMGGGSSDAATCLLGLLHLWGAHLTIGELAQLSLQIGADVPFFVHGENAWVSGIGDIIEPLHSTEHGRNALKLLENQQFVVVKPQSGISTHDIFSDPRLRRDHPPAIISGFAANPVGFGCNDLQAVAQGHCSEMNAALEWLECQGLAPRMTGSGSAVFAPLLGTEQVFDCAGAPNNSRTKVCTVLASHPLAGWL